MNQTDRELLELAAKACGWVRYGPNEFDPKVECVTWLDLETGEPHWSDMWNPLANDGDALRLAVKLLLTINLTECQCCVHVSANQLDGDGPDISVRYSEEFRDCEVTDVNTATRRAIVRAAAEIGKTMLWPRSA